MELKQTQLKELVVEYFQRRADTDVQPDAGSTYRVTLKSEVAQTDFGGREQLSLIFDVDRAFESPESELITANHPFLDVIRNDLGRDPQSDPRLGDAYVLAQLLDLDGRPSIPQLTFSSTAPDVRYQLTYYPTFVLTYRVVYETDERSENIVRLCYDAVSGAPQPHLVPMLQRITPIGGLPDDGVSVDAANPAPILEGGRAEIERRIAADVQFMGRQISQLLEAEKQRLTEHYATEIASVQARDIVTREQLKERLDKDIADLERKFTGRVSVQLLSVLRLWWPVANYTMHFSGRHGDFSIDRIHYDTRINRANFFHCDVCGNEISYDICVTGRHSLCGGRCSKGSDRCATCSDPFCPDHGSLCRDCTQPVCQHDRKPCGYGNHPADALYCPNCLVDSFERRPLCRECREDCDLCHRHFPHERMATCRVGHERICSGHHLDPDAFECQECSQVACRTHAVATADSTWACQDHASVTSCCGRTYVLSRLKTCVVDSHEVLCPDHHVLCVDCGQAVCEEHRYALYHAADAQICAKCRQTCNQCPAERSYQRSELVACGTCGDSVCSEHRQACTVCSAIVCQKHIQIGADNEPLCPHHARVATCCNRVFMASKLLPCNNNSDEALCPEHRVACASCGQVVCEHHRSPLSLKRGRFTCATCRRTCGLCPPENSYLQAELATCATCGRAACSSHHKTCVVGGEVVCRDDLRLSVNDEPLCHQHAATCVQCSSGPNQPIYRSDSLRTCTVCRRGACQTHRMACEICQKTFMCTAHRSTQPACASCGRVTCGSRGCQAASHTCQSCGMAYCRHCIQSNSGRCLTCGGLTGVEVTSEWLSFLGRLQSSVDENIARILMEIIESPARVLLRAASNKTYSVVVAHYTPQWYKVWKSPQQIRIVMQRDGKVQRVMIEPVDS